MSLILKHSPIKTQLLKSQFLTMLSSFFKEHFLPCPTAFSTVFLVNITLSLHHKRIALPDSPKTSLPKVRCHPYWVQILQGSRCEKPLLLVCARQSSCAQCCWVKFLVTFAPRLCCPGFFWGRKPHVQDKDFCKGSQVFSNQQLGHFLLHYSPLAHALLKTEYGSNSAKTFKPFF